jgi:inner membrane protein
MENYTESTETSFWQRQAVTIKGVIIFLLVLFLLIPTAMIESLIVEREGRRREAVAEISGKWGQGQSVTGPILAVPYEQTFRSDDSKTATTEVKYAYFLPDSLAIAGQVNPEKRHRGIFDAVLYGSQLTLEGIFAHPRLENLIPAGSVVLWNKCALILGIPDLRGLEDQVRVDWDGKPGVFEPGIAVPRILESGIHVPLPLAPGNLGEHHFRIQASLKGSQNLFFTPVGKVTLVHLSAPWPDPSFTGAFLPDRKEISPAGFDASWKVLNLNRNYPQQWLEDQKMNLSATAFGVDFLLPVDNYQKSTRSVKYAILFISLTFLSVFFLELRQAKRVHPFQYALIGLALVIFYSLLVSISEHIPFDFAYLVAAIMTVGLTGLYTRSLFQSNRMATLVAGTLSLLYGFLFVVLQLQDYALLMGSLGLFVILAAVMYFSRKISMQG